MSLFGFRIGFGKKMRLINGGGKEILWVILIVNNSLFIICKYIYFIYLILMIYFKIVKYL